MLHQTNAKHKNLYEAYFKTKDIFLDIFLMSVAVALLGSLAQIRFPLWPVPITMQTFGIFTIAFFFGARKGTLTMLLYLLIGVAGIGVFSGGKSGIQTLLGPTGGYLIGFVFAVLILGILIEKGWGRNLPSILVCMLLAEILIYIPGLIGLAYSFPDSTFNEILTMGFIPFIVGDGIKALFAALIFPYLWQGADKIKKAA